MTAIGLFVAIPAVLAYNFFVRLNRVTNNKFDTFAHDLHDFFATGSRVGEVGRSSADPRTTDGARPWPSVPVTIAAARWPRSTSRPSST